MGHSLARFRYKAAINTRSLQRLKNAQLAWHWDRHHSRGNFNLVRVSQIRTVC